MVVPSTVEEFLEVVVKSGVLEKDVLDPYLHQMRAAGGVPDKPKKLGAALVRDGLLTPFQVSQFLQGKWRGFLISGKYRLLDHLGAGGMGNVFLCEHKSMRRRVAIKVLPAAQAKDPAALERFYREARAVAALDHPNIVRAHDIDHDGRYHFLVLEYVEGVSLQDLVKRGGPMDVTRAAHYIRQAALGLHHAHLAGLVHRDVKPGNLLLDRQGIVKILDMGLARFFHDEADGLTKEHDEHNILGTADYLAPEQAINSHAVDIRADIYSLGATFYFLLAGQPPFPDGSVAQKLVAHQMKTPEPVAKLRPETPEGLTAVIEKMMAKDPAQRYQSPAELYEALAPWTQTPIPPPREDEMPSSGRRVRSGSASEIHLSQPSTPSPSLAPWLSSGPTIFPSAEATSNRLPSVASPPAAAWVKQWRVKGLAAAQQLRRRPVLAGAAAAVVVLLVTLAGWACTRLLSASEPTPTPSPVVAGYPGRTLSAPATQPAAAPNPAGSIRRIQSGRYEAAVDSDGRLTSLHANGVEFLASPRGLPGGGYLCQEAGRGAPRLTVAAPTETNVVAAHGDEASVRYEFGPDGLTWTAANETDEPLALFLLLNTSVAAAGDGGGDVQRPPVLQEEWATSVWYAGDARLQVRGATRVWGEPGRPWQTVYAEVPPRGTRQLVLELSGVSSEEAAAVAALGRPAAEPTAAVPGAQSYLCVMSLDDLKERVVLTSPDRWDCPIWTPDGKSVLYSGGGRLHRVSLADGPAGDFAVEGQNTNRDYAFSPDGRRLAVTCGDALYLVPSEGGPAAEVPPRKSGYIHGWSPDSRTLVYTASRDKGPFSIYSRLADGGEETRLLSYGGFGDAPEFSTDGKWIYFSCDKSGRAKIWRMPAAGAGTDDAQAEQVTDDGYRDWFPHPSPDGKWLLFVSDPAGQGSGVPDRQNVVLRLAPLPGDQPRAARVREVVRLVGGQGTINAPCWAPDGRSFAYIRYAPK